MHPLLYKRMELRRLYTCGMMTVAWLLSISVTVPVFVFDLAEAWEEGSQMHCDIPKVRRLNFKLTVD
jgi:hypothetical protein